MRSLIMILALVLSLDCMGAPVGDTRCFRADRVEFKESRGRIRVVGEPAKKTSVDVLIEVDCRSGALVVPQTAEQLVEALERALPSDHKIAISKGSIVTSYKHGNYAASADDDLFFHFTRLWNLRYGAPACEGFEGFRDEDFACYFSALEAPRSRYRELINYNPPAVRMSL
jgi:hypothetical protein